MRSLVIIILAAMCGMMAEARTIHRSFRNGYPVFDGVSMRQNPNAVSLASPKAAQQKTVVVTNRVTLTKEQAERMVRAKGQKSKTGVSTTPKKGGTSK